MSASKSEYLVNLSTLMRHAAAERILGQFFLDLDSDPFSESTVRTAHSCGYQSRARRFVADMRAADPATAQQIEVAARARLITGHSVQ